MTGTGPILETERLILRLPQMGDFERYAALMADEDACRYIGGHLPRGAAWRRFLQMPGAWTLQGFAMFSVQEKASGQWVGQIGPWKPDGWPGNEIGYAFHPDAWGRGYALESAVAAIDWSFVHLGWDDIIHCISPDNLASKKVAQRLGSSLLREGRLLPPPSEEHHIEVWGQTRAEWMEHRKRFD
ncbi:GNAT family N-acetyltransferase [Luteimonas kalidii]|uniref:GNAT family N-acetyltransferase n=1 Tax=Luteimonas kalidii TaxID=3042025 RepID=A0ABT6JT61_9GAMM|nr:GNAT family N-acetyltransferase [Luteimonas kalidii]MDH5833874.1 GNAT family N-acetyltransferase [Luteimonas kalidii]